MVEHLGTNHHHFDQIITPGFACDIDETLSETTIPSFEAMIQAFGSPDNMTAQELLENFRFLEKVPTWQTQEHFDWIHEYFSLPETYQHLDLKPHAREALDEITKKTPLAAYITARRYHLHDVTVDWKQEVKLPKAPLLMRTEQEVINRRGEWKAQLLYHLFPQVTGIVDDDPNLPLALEKIGYKGFLIMFGHHSTPSLSYEAYAAPDWKVTKDILLGR
ncbi:MAG: hypothetical protein KC535_04560 [Nanoarchaeota archaeon]|nr:hypothetical protein [Nanoarchaeota archaeon]